MTHALRGLAVLAMLLTLGASATAQVTFEQRLMGPAEARFFTPVAIDGDHAVVGAPWEMVGEERRGAAYVFTRGALGTWSLTQRLIPSDAVQAREFGFAVALQGSRLVVTARGREDPAPGFGAAYVYSRSGTSFTEVTRLAYGNGLPNYPDGFGTSLALDGDTIVVGTPFVNGAYAYTLSGGAWVERVLAPPPGSSYFGQSVGISGTTVCVGAPNDTVGGNLGQGRTSIYTRSGLTWTLVQTVAATDGERADNFGNECAVSGDTVVVGVDQDDAPLQNQGAVYVYARSGGTWSFQQKLTASTPGAGDRFGSSVAVIGDTLLIGAATGVPSPGQGRAYLFRRSGGTWAEAEAIPTADGGINGGFGESVAMDGQRAIVGAARWTTDRGYAHILRLPANTSGVPGPPANFQASVSGNSVSMSWSAPTSGGSASTYTVIARTITGQLLTTLDVGSALSFLVSAPNGVYQVSVAAMNAAGIGVESVSRTITVPTAVALPGAPGGLAATVSGDAATFTWTPPSGGGVPSGYVLVAGSTPGFSTPIATLPLPVSPTSTTVGAIPPGRYWVRLVAVNASGSGTPSNEVEVAVAVPTPPGAPALNPAVVSGRTVTLSWTPGAGGTPTSFTVTAATVSGGPVVASLPVSGTTLTVTDVPPGSYFVQVRAANGAGSSAPSNEIVVVVP